MHARPARIRGVPNPDRLTGLDSSFLHLERDSAHMHVAGCMVFKGDAPEYEELVAEIGARLHLVPRYRQRLAFVPLNQGRPVWVDDPHFNITYHVRHTALPRPGGPEELKRLAGRVLRRGCNPAGPRGGQQGSSSRLAAHPRSPPTPRPNGHCRGEGTSQLSGVGQGISARDHSPDLGRRGGLEAPIQGYPGRCLPGVLAD